MNLTKNRTCGDCIVCCSYLKIKAPELDKPACQHCPHATLPLDSDPERNLYYTGGDPDGKNCSVYGTDKRPKVCEEYKCLWLQGFGDEEDRPDKIGILIDTVHNIENAIECKPLWKGADEDPKAIEAILRMSRQSNKVAVLTTFLEKKIKKLIGRPS